MSSRGKLYYVRLDGWSTEVMSMYQIEGASSHAISLILTVQWSNHTVITNVQICVCRGENEL